MFCPDTQVHRKMDKMDVLFFLPEKPRKVCHICIIIADQTGSYVSFLGNIRLSRIFTPRFKLLYHFYE